MSKRRRWQLMLVGLVVLAVPVGGYVLGQQLGLLLTIVGFQALLIGILLRVWLSLDASLRLTRQKGRKEHLRLRTRLDKRLQGQSREVERQHRRLLTRLAKELSGHAREERKQHSELRSHLEKKISDYTKENQRRQEGTLKSIQDVYDARLLSLLTEIRATQEEQVSGPSTRMSIDLRSIDAARRVDLERRRFLEKHGYPLNIDRPRSFNEKVCWRKLFDRNPLFPIVVDKFQVRAFLETMLGKTDADRYLNPLLFETQDPDAIPFDALPADYVIKLTHGYAMNVLVRAETKVSREEVVALCRKWIQTDFGLASNQWAYSEVPRRIIGEGLFSDGQGQPPREFKLHMFGGECGLIQVHDSHGAWYDGHTTGESGSVVTQTFYTPDWVEVTPKAGLVSDPQPEPPPELEEVSALARRLSSPFDYIRVDCYVAGGKVRFGELTIYPQAGIGRFATAELDFELGRLWRL